MSQTTHSLIDAVKDRLPLQDLVAETFTVIPAKAGTSGHTLTTREHDSLKLRTDWQTWHWYSRGLRGDIFDWYQLQHRRDFPTALAALAQRAGLTAPNGSGSAPGLGKDALHARCRPVASGRRPARRTSHRRPPRSRPRQDT